MIAKTEFLKLAELKYEEIQKLEGTPSFYDYETVLSDKKI